MFNGHVGRDELDRLHVHFQLELRLLLEQSRELFGDGRPPDDFFTGGAIEIDSVGRPVIGQRLGVVLIERLDVGGDHLANGRSVRICFNSTCRSLAFAASTITEKSIPILRSLPVLNFGSTRVPRRFHIVSDFSDFHPFQAGGVADRLAPSANLGRSFDPNGPPVN